MKLFKALFRIMVILLVACSLQNCQDLAFQSLESEIHAQAKAWKQVQSPKEEHAFTITAITNNDNPPLNHFLVSIYGIGGTITVDWGDGTSTTHNLNDGGYSVDVQKLYESSGRYHVSITGDLKNVTAFKSSYGQGLFDEINLKPLTNLKDLRVSSVPGPETIDVSHNKKLEVLSLNDMSELREIRLPKQHSLWAVSIAGNSNITTSTVDALINSVYKTAVKKQIWGFLHVHRSYDDEGITEMVATPSPTAITQLTELQNTYSWEILPVMPQSSDVNHQDSPFQ